MLQTQTVEPRTLDVLKKLMKVPELSDFVLVEEAEETEDPVSLTGQTWESVKIFIQQKVREYLK